MAQQIFCIPTGVGTFGFQIVLYFAVADFNLTIDLAATQTANHNFIANLLQKVGIDNSLRIQRIAKFIHAKPVAFGN